ncbi:MAG: plasmid mobilization relaxosome protein MobC [Giesbergeria sp.]|nr:plasmid mobilization relaxosome protein MobC [Giesbergeria sp.]
MARPVKSDDEKLSHTVAFRLTDGDFLAYKRKFSASGLTQSEFFREHVLTNTTQVVAKPKASADTKRAVFLLQKASNNINQLAHRANADHLAGILSESSFLAILSQLDQLNSFMLEQTSETQK